MVAEYASLVEVLVLTSGWKGSSVYWNGRVTYVPTRITREVDPTGAGDIYAAAFLVPTGRNGGPSRGGSFRESGRIVLCRTRWNKWHPDETGNQAVPRNRPYEQHTQAKVN